MSHHGFNVQWLFNAQAGAALRRSLHLHRAPGYLVTAVPELADLGLTRSVRGHQPMSVSHHRPGAVSERHDGFDVDARRLDLIRAF
ncbi:hypothetical protein AB0K00_49900 [Dactylosporangium sp. NPDC049525]|uniref:hypothetical protein n=1 Tax=Dactylosporangium sp. NPDC049525 TaxID=3154730 RepID=UPI00342BEA3E